MTTAATFEIVRPRHAQAVPRAARMTAAGKVASTTRATNSAAYRWSGAATGASTPTPRNAAYAIAHAATTMPRRSQTRPLISSHAPAAAMIRIGQPRAEAVRASALVARAGNGAPPRTGTAGAAG